MLKQSLITLFIVSTQFAIAQKTTKNQDEPYAPIYSFYYPSGQWELITQNESFLDSLISDIIQKSDIQNITINIEGHTDDVGNSISNMILSQKRAQAVADHLIKKGVNSSQIKIYYFGESKPEKRKIAISKKIKDIRYANRRVVIRIEKTTANIGFAQ